MDDILDDLLRCAKRCERVARLFKEEPIDVMQKRLFEATGIVQKAWSGSWIGYHARLYLEGLRPRLPNEGFDVNWGLLDRLSSATRGEWREYEYEEILEAILERAGRPETKTIESAAGAAKRVFKESKAQVLPTLDATISVHDDSVLKGIRDKVGKLQSHMRSTELMSVRIPKTMITQDQVALAQGPQAPPHIAFEAWLLEQLSYGEQASQLAELIRHATTYLQKKYKMAGKSVGKAGGKIFIGHGRSLLWLKLKGFVVEELELEYEEFNREPVAGLSTKERLEAMLDGSAVALLVMTGEDEDAGGQLHARENVIHEAGLFQGRYGFERAIVLLEEGCEEFSNIVGIGQIRFPKGQIEAGFNEVRRVLKREGLV